MADLEQVASDLNSASQSLQELREKYDGALDLLDNKNTEITAALESAKSNALQEVQTASDTATSQISQLKDTSLNAVNEAKNTATSEISSKKDEALGEFSQATSEFNSTKEEALFQIEQAKAEQGEKITALEQAKESITADLNKKPKLLTENLTWTVGSGGDYEDLQTAITEASKYIGMKDRYIFIKIKNGYTLSRNLIINGLNCTLFIQGENGKTDELILQGNDVDLMFITITQNSQEVIFSNITVKAVGGKCSVLADIGGILQVRDCIFKGTFEDCLSANNGGQIYIINSLISTSYDKGCYIVTSHHGSTVKFDAGVQFKYDGVGVNCIAFNVTSGGNINNLWWARPAISVTGKFDWGALLFSGGLFFNKGIDFSGCTFINGKYPQVTGQWTTNGYIAVN